MSVKQKRKIFTCDNSIKTLEQVPEITNLLLVSLQDITPTTIVSQDILRLGQSLNELNAPLTKVIKAFKDTLIGHIRACGRIQPGELSAHVIETPACSPGWKEEAIALARTLHCQKYGTEDGFAEERFVAAIQAKYARKDPRLKIISTIPTNNC